MIHLDTNFLILLIVPGTAEEGFVRRAAGAGEEFNFGVAVWAEFLCGPVTPEQRRLAASMLPNPEPLLV